MGMALLYIAIGFVDGLAVPVQGWEREDGKVNRYVQYSPTSMVNLELIRKVNQDKSKCNQLHEIHPNFSICLPHSCSH
jgi:hypothetical protein